MKHFLIYLFCFSGCFNPAYMQCTWCYDGLGLQPTTIIGSGSFNLDFFSREDNNSLFSVTSNYNHSNISANFGNIDFSLDINFNPGIGNPISGGWDLSDLNYFGSLNDLSNAFKSSTSVPDLTSTGVIGNGLGLDYVPFEIADPIDPVSGRFLIKESDLVLAGPLPLKIIRNYFSELGAGVSSIGYGWRLNFVPFLVFRGADDEILSAAESDGTILNYTRSNISNFPAWIETVEYSKGSLVSHNALIWKALVNTSAIPSQGSSHWAAINEVWKIQNNITPEDDLNPQLTNRNIRGVGGIYNPFGNRIEITEELINGTINTKVYRLIASDGSIREFHEQSYPVGTGTGTVSRTRPYLQKWTDSNGNYLDFAFGQVSGVSGYGLLKQVNSSNGSFLNFYYNRNGLLTSIHANDGRRVKYFYDDQADLKRVIRSDNSEIYYDYERFGPLAEYSSHRIIRVTEPDGRILFNKYDGEGRVFEQWYTVGQGTELERIATMEYHHVEVGETLTGWTRVYDYRNEPSQTPETDTNCTLYEYEHSLITGITDPLGQSIEQEWYLGRYGVNGSAEAHPDVDGVSLVTGHFSDETDFSGFDGDSPGGFAKGLKWKKDKRGLITYYWYDSRGNVILQKEVGDLDGIADTLEVSETSYTYNEKNLIETVIMANGVRVESSYEYPQYPYLKAREETFINNNLVSVNYHTYQDVLGADRFVKGVPSRFSDGLNSNSSNPTDDTDSTHIQYQYDTRGFLTGTIRYATAGGYPETPNAEIDEVAQFHYNDRGELVESWLQLEDGSRKGYRHLQYDGAGRPTRVQIYNDDDILLKGSDLYYNQSGDVVWVDGPKSDPEDYVFKDYDSAGRLIAEIFWKSEANADGTRVIAYGGGAILEQPIRTYQYNEFGNLIRVNDPNGNYRLYEHDLLGQTKEVRYYDVDDVYLGKENYSYEAGSKIASYTDRRGGVTTYTYNSRGQLTQLDTPDGSKTQRRYLTDGRVDKVFMANGYYWQLDYSKSEEFTMSHKFYQPNGAPYLTNVLKQVEYITKYNRQGNVVEQIDPEGYAVRSQYDGLGRLLKSESVNASQNTNGDSAEISVYQAYSKDGLTAWTINEQLEGTVTEFDVLGRPLRTVVTEVPSDWQDPQTLWTPNDFPDSNISRVESYRYDPDFNWIEITNGDPQENPLGNDPNEKIYSQSRYYTDTFGNTVLSVNEGPSIRRHQIRRYDLIGNMIESQDVLGQRTSFEYDGLSRVVQSKLPDGTELKYRYTPGGDLSHRIMPNGMIERNIYDLAGRIKRSWLESGTEKSREIDYAYYNRGSSYVGLIQKVVDQSRGITTDYEEYDPFDRVLRRSIDGNEEVVGYKSRYAYDRRGYLVSTERDYLDLSHEDSRIEWLIDGNGNIYEEKILTRSGSGAYAEHSNFRQQWNTVGRRSALYNQLANQSELYAFEYDAAGALEQNTFQPSPGVAQTFYMQHYKSGFLSQINGPVLSRRYHYDSTFPSGRLAQIHYGVESNGGANPDYLDVNASWRNDDLRSSTGLSGSAALASGDSVLIQNRLHSYTYDDRSRLVRETISGAMQADVTENSTYLSPLGQVASENQNIASSFTFDPRGLDVKILTTHDRNDVYDFPNISDDPIYWEETRQAIADGGLNGFAQVESELLRLRNNPHDPDLAYLASGTSIDAGKIELQVKNLATNEIFPVEDVTFNPHSADGAWSAPLDLKEGDYELQAIAIHASLGDQTSPDIHRFQITDPTSESTDSAYDGQGYTERRDWKNGDAQTFVWDAGGRLLEVIDERANVQWKATYDPQGRRLKVVRQTLDNPTEIETLKSYYDPIASFLEIAIDYNGERTWKIYGPDLSGAYGGLEGIGGCLAYYSKLDSTLYPVMSDLLGNQVAHVENMGSVQQIILNPTPTAAYGARDGQQMKYLGDLDTDQSASSPWLAASWRGYRADVTGFIYMGFRYYDPVGGRFISPDPLGHGESMDLYSYVNGDPINHVDPWGLGALGNDLNAFSFSPVQAWEADQNDLLNGNYSSSFVDYVDYVLDGGPYSSFYGPQVTTASGGEYRLSSSTVYLGFVGGLPEVYATSITALDYKGDSLNVSSFYHGPPGLQDQTDLMFGVGSALLKSGFKGAIDEIASESTNGLSDLRGLTNFAAKRTAFEIAQSGGKHAGFLKKHQGLSRRELLKSQRRLQRRIDQHEALLKDPQKAMKQMNKGDWNALDPRQQKDLLENKWPTDIQRQKEQLNIIEGLLK